jgi:hypothetical protein
MDKSAHADVGFEIDAKGVHREEGDHVFGTDFLESGCGQKGDNGSEYHRFWSINHVLVYLIANISKKVEKSE